MAARTGRVWLPLLVVALSLAFALPLVGRGIILSDEGYLLQQALDLLDGRVMYRDMDAFITPGMWFVLAGLFSIVEPSVIATRYLMLAAFALLCLTGYRIVAPVAGAAAALAAVAAMFAFAVWAFPAWTFAFYSPIAVLLALLGVERLLAWQRSGRPRDLFLVGLWLGLAIAVKQNYGVFALTGAALAWAATRLDGSRSDRRPFEGAGLELAAGTLGVASAGLPFLAYLLATGALGDAWYSLVVHPFEFAGRHDIPFAPLSDLLRPALYTDAVEKLTYLSYGFHRAGPIGWLQFVRGTHRLHVLAYWLPVAIFLAGLALAFVSGRRQGRRIDAPLFAVASVGGLLFLGVLPRADYNHLMNVYQPVPIAAAIVVARGLALTRSRVTRGAVIGVLSVLALLYGGTALTWYVSLLRSHVMKVDVPRGGVLVDAVDAIRLDDLMHAVETHSEPGAPLLTVPDLTMLNFLTDRPVPSAYYNLYEHHIAADGGAAVVAGAEASGVDLVITSFDNFFSDRVGLLDYAPALSDYVITHFERSFIGADQNYIVYRRRETPLEQHAHFDAIADCSHGDAGLADVRHHLLFSSLYHRSRPGQPIPPEGVTTVCRLTVPEAGGVLSLEIGYLRPRAVAPGTQLVGEVSIAEAGAAPHRLHYQTLPVLPSRGSRRQQAFRRVDLTLDAQAGREVEIVFHTRLSGRVASHPFDWKGFAMVYRDPRLQAEAGGAHP